MGQNCVRELPINPKTLKMLDFQKVEIDRNLKKYYLLKLGISVFIKVKLTEGFTLIIEEVIFKLYHMVHCNAQKNL